MATFVEKSGHVARKSGQNGKKFDSRKFHHQRNCQKRPFLAKKVVIVTTFEKKSGHKKYLEKVIFSQKVSQKGLFWAFLALFEILFDHFDRFWPNVHFFSWVDIKNNFYKITKMATKSGHLAKDRFWC